ncbi:MAG: sigma-54 dependent transcriptional regulator [Chromatiales bacterium]|jgi:DNA-binding NtrC family response regulator|nr:sigma-54 dependent transcriptional regulator [Chromatiales bacterium]MDX9767116.1 sigma-54 dependent transcriptional regulator [Ectothiorhodospiraceae bacterium]
MSRPQHICLIEDDEIMGESLCDRFELEGFGFEWYRSAEAALAVFDLRSFDVVISDIRLPDMNGDELFMQMKRRRSDVPPWIFITGYGAIDRAVSLLKQGATDYITKPFDLDSLIDKLRNQIAVVSGPDAPAGGEHVALGVSPAMRRIEALLPRLAQQANTVLITGESGVGKEAVARELHRLDPACEGRPFVPVNCGAVTESLLEAELFGYEKGAFTGAVRTKPGVFEQAAGGTLFLDEIGDMPLVMQVKLLRVIQDRQVVRVGGETPIAVSLKLICATHRDLKQMVDAGTFREDLFYRIHVIHLKIPPLRERREDIPWLARQFLDEYTAMHGGEGKRLPPGIERALLNYAWPGNVRELKHAIERACILSHGEALEMESLFGDVDVGTTSAPAAGDSLGQYLRACEREFITQALEHHEGRIGQTADSLGISRKNLWERMKRLGISARE